MCNVLTRGELREGPRPPGRSYGTCCECNHFKIQVHTKSTQTGLSVYTQDDSRDSARGISALAAEKPSVRQQGVGPARQAPTAEKGGARTRLACFDWAEAAAAGSRGLRAGLVTNRACSLAKIAGRGG